jgi:plastocyanin
MNSKTSFLRVLLQVRFVWIYLALGSALPGFASVTNVSIVDFSFNPAMVQINANDQVKWTWVGGAPHSSTSANSLWDSGVHNTGFTFTQAFPATGNFSYFCTVHPFMTGSVSVQGAANTNTAPTVVAQPGSQTVQVGQNVTFSVTATGTSPLSYQWRFNGANIPNATATSLVLNNVQTNNAGNYSVIVSNPLGMATSTDATLTVRGQPVGTSSATFNGLFYDPNGVSPQNSGSFNLVMTSTAKFTGRLQLGNSRLPLKGQFDADGNATNVIARPMQNQLTVVLHVNLANPGQITGFLTDGTHSAAIIGDRAVFDGRQNLAPQAGQYTMIIPGTDGSNTQPGGDGFATITVDNTGKISLTGSLADGTKIAQSSVVSGNGLWPFFVPLYGGQGLIIGQLIFQSTTNSDVSGDVVWTKPNMATARFYPAGFNLTTTASGLRYHRPITGNKVLNITTGTVSLSGNELPQASTSNINVDLTGRVTSTSSNKLTLTFRATTGTFTGKVLNPGTTKTLSFNGVVLQALDLGTGFFLGTNQSGQVLLEGSP